ncbi:MAG: hypothetical protein AB1Z98_36120 [Nannocystaceae bacterium]
MSNYDPMELARARVLLARSLRDLGREQERAATLAEAARDVYRREGARAARELAELAELAAWLDESAEP